LVGEAAGFGPFAPNRVRLTQHLHNPLLLLEMGRKRYFGLAKFFPVDPHLTYPAITQFLECPFPPLIPQPKGKVVCVKPTFSNLKPGYVIAEYNRFRIAFKDGRLAHKVSAVSIVQQHVSLFKAMSR